MTEQELCSFVEKWNCRSERHAAWVVYASPIHEVEVHPLETNAVAWVVEMLDEMMELHDADATKWVEASATAADGKTYWARVDANKVKQIPERPDALGLAQAMAQERAEYLAQCRSAKEA